MNKVWAAVVVNPASGNGRTGRRWPEIARALHDGGIKFDYRFTKGPGDATSITRQFLADGHDLVISVGGDGTLNEVVNGFFKDKKPINPSAAVSLLPAGTGRDFIRTLNIPVELAAAVNHLLNTSPRLIDLGLVKYRNMVGSREERYFINVAGLGLDGDTVARVNRAGKICGGFLPFLIGTLFSLLLYHNRLATVTVDGVLICSERIVTVVIGNGCYFGGGMQIAPGAVIDDGLFEIVILHSLNKLRLIANLPRVYRGTHLSHPRVSVLRGKVIDIQATDWTLLNLDGEQPGQAPVLIEMIPKAINLKA